MDRLTPVNIKDRTREGRPCYVTVTLNKLSNARRIEVESRRYKAVEAMEKNCMSVRHRIVKNT